MTFVFSIWYFVIAVLVVGIFACLFIFFKMDKKDRVLLDQFIKEQTQENQQQEAITENENKVE